MAKKDTTPTELGDSGITLQDTDAKWSDSLYVKLAAIHKSVNFLKKENKGFNFQYVSSTQALLAVRSVMDDVGVLLIPSVTKAEVRDHETKKGNHEYFTEMWFDMTWVNIDNPEEQCACTWYGQGLDDGEKGPGKAMTYAEKFFILKFFNIATDKEDPDNADNQKKAQESSRNRLPANSKPVPPVKQAPPAGPPEHIKLVLDSPTHKQMMNDHMASAGMGKKDMTKLLAGIWDDANHEKDNYLDRVVYELKPKGETVTVPAPDALDPHDNHVMTEDPDGQLPF